MGTWISMILAIGCAGMTLSIVKTCTEVQTICFIIIVCAFIHAVMARYVQYRIVAKIKKEKGEDDIAGKDIAHAEIVEATKHVFMEDIGFCLYFFAYFGIFGYVCSGLGAFSDCTTEETGPGWMSGCIMIMYGMGTSSYFFCWFCTQVCCAKGKKAAAGARGAGAGGAAPEQVGMA